MARLIDADELIEIAHRIRLDSRERIEQMIEFAPTVDPVRYGKWINDKGIYKCTACNDLCLVAGWAHCIPEKQMYEVFKFCPNCGAKMKEDELEEPEINPCRGCVDYDGRGGCKSNGGCGAEMDEVME